mmetsp:Transcript_67428/g.190064  ORF Transcript_67428/g.190064 Transcript_67428/m.190064 type:complete len:854 (-) Transcript_67428:116-2677(-)
MADPTACTASAMAPLSATGNAALELVMRLPSAERYMLVQKLLADPPVAAAEEVVEEAATKEVTFVGQCSLGLFVLFITCLGFYFARMIRQEGMRYARRNADGQGTFKAYLKYRFGYWYTWTKGSAGIVLMLMSVFLLVLGGVLMKVCTEMPLPEGLWVTWLWIAAPDGGGSADTPIARMIGLAISLGGMLVFGLMLSVISATFESTLQGLREGIGPVIEGDHIVILGYLTPMLQIIAKELCIANESEGGVLISILSPLPKPEVEEFLRTADGDIADWAKSSQVVVRSGDACNAADLTKVAVQGAKKVIIMSKPGVSREEADAFTINVLLTLRNNHWPSHGSCLVQCQLVRNHGVFKRLLNEKSVVFSTSDFIGELMVHCSRQSGLAHVVRSIFCFEGDEFYIQHIEGTAGRTFMEVLFALPGVIPVGIKAPGRSLEVLPAMDRILGDDDALCVLAEDDSSIPTRASPPKSAGVPGSAKKPRRARIVERGADQAEGGQTVIICGWSEKIIGAILFELDCNIGSRSRVVIHSPQQIAVREQFLEAAQKRRKHFYQNFTIEHQQSPLGARFRLEELPLEIATMILILADYSCTSASHADSQTMAIIMQVQDILDMKCGPGGSSAVIMPQLLDTHTEETLVQTGIHNYIMSSRLAARIMAVVCEVPQTIQLIDCLVTTKVCKLSIAKVSDYPAAASLDIGAGVSFDDVTRVACLADEVVLGWSQEGAGEAGPWELNPKDKLLKRSWPDDARLIVLMRTSRHPEHAEHAASIVANGAGGRHLQRAASSQLLGGGPSRPVLQRAATSDALGAPDRHVERGAPGVLARLPEYDGTRQRFFNARGEFDVCGLMLGAAKKGR